jgi:hypothetical protein
MLEVKHPIRLVNSVLRRSVSDVGNISLSYFLLLLSAVENKLLTISQLFGALQTIKTKFLNPRKIVIKDLWGEGFMSMLLHKVLTRDGRSLKTFLDPFTSDKALKRLMGDLDKKLKRLPHFEVLLLKSSRAIANHVTQGLDIDRQRHIRLIAQIQAQIAHKFERQSPHAK